MIIIVQTAEAYQFPLWYSESGAICVAGVLGLEPRLTEPESVGLPITLYPKGFRPGGSNPAGARTNFTVSRVSAPNCLWLARVARDDRAQVSWTWVRSFMSRDRP
jgi:hypothetical protein